MEKQLIVDEAEVAALERKAADDHAALKDEAANARRVAAIEVGRIVGSFVGLRWVHVLYASR